MYAGKLFDQNFLFQTLQHLAAQRLKLRGLLLGQRRGEAVLDLLADGQAQLMQLHAARLKLDFFAPPVQIGRASCRERV